MKIYTLERRQRIPVSIGQAWEFFSDASNLARITPASLGLVVTSALPPRMHPGMIVTYTIRPFPGTTAGWVTEITHVVERELFVDEQRFGPYRFWHHQHHFREIPGGVEIRDLVHYALPMGPAGRLVGRWMVAPRLESVFDFRRKALEERFGKMD